MSLIITNKRSFIIFLLPFLLFIVKSQLTIRDKSIIENYILTAQSKNTALFFEDSDNFKSTKEAISVLKLLGIEVKYSKDICKRISEIKDIDDNIITINKLLECKIDYKSYKPDFTKQKIEDLYHEALIMDLLNINQWEQIFKILKHFLISENGKFSLYKISGNKKKSILATALGMEIMVLVAQKNPELKEDITPILKKSVDSILKSYAVLKLSYNKIA